MTVELNVPLLRKTMEYIEAHPEEWNQAHWARRIQGCGTTMCFAGTAVTLAGWDISWHIDGTAISSACTKDGVKRSIMQVAAEELGLNYDQADILFGYMTVSPDALKRRIEVLTGVKL